MIIKKKVGFTPGGIGSVSHNEPFRIIDAEINVPCFGDLTLYLFSNGTSEKGKFFTNYCIAQVDKPLPNVDPERWKSVCKIIDTGDKEYFLLVDKT